jgi:bleomycin hydrolase
MKNIIYLFISAILLFNNISYAQETTGDKGKFIDPKSEYWDKVQQDIKEFNKKEEKKREVFKVDFSTMDIPQSASEFTQVWHQEPKNQGYTGTCWSWSATSFFESEIYRVHNIQLKLSPIYSAYWEYIEKAKRFVRERGNSEFGEGSEANALKRLWNQYGILPEEIYSGMLPGQKAHDHSKMFKEMKNYLTGIKSSNCWNEKEVTATIKSILDHYLGAPPEQFTWQGKKYTPQEFFRSVVNLKMEDYVDVISLMQEPYYKKILYNVPDNWWFDSSYINVPLNIYMSAIKSAISRGYSVCLGGDVSEAGLDSYAKAAIVPTFDIPSEYIDENARQFRFLNGTTTDDHGIHLVGYLEKNGKMWFLIKDSGSGAFNTGDKGYFFYHEDYVKLKMVDCMVHKDVADEILIKFASN